MPAGAHAIYGTFRSAEMHVTEGPNLMTIIDTFYNTFILLSSFPLPFPFPFHSFLTPALKTIILFPKRELVNKSTEAG